MLIYFHLIETGLLSLNFEKFETEIEVGIENCPAIALLLRGLLNPYKIYDEIFAERKNNAHLCHKSAIAG